MTGPTLYDIQAESKRIPFFANVRREIARTLREAHRKNPAVARLLVRRMKEAEISTIEAFWNPPVTALERRLGLGKHGD